MLRAQNKFTPGFMVLLTLLFLGRVAAQLIEFFVDVPFIPDFERWHSATLPYGLLLSAQIIILWVMGRVCYRACRGTTRYSRKLGVGLAAAGAFYLASMMLRHLLGLTLLSHTVWFTSSLSIYFHYVLSAFVLTTGYLHLGNAERRSPATTCRTG